jgi:acyl dehydratase
MSESTLTSPSATTAFTDLASLEAAVGSGPYLSPWVTVTQEMIDEFADVTGDPQWIHLDVERAKRESPFGTTIAHGFLTLSLLSNLIGRTISYPTAKMGVNYGFERVRFVSPVPAGAQIQAGFTLQEVKPADIGVQIAWAVEVRVRDAAKPALAAVWLSRVVL